MAWASEVPWFDSRQRQEILLFSEAHRSAPGSSQPPIQLVLWGFFPGVKRPGYEADNSSPTYWGYEWEELYCHSLKCLHGAHTNTFSRSVRIPLSPRLSWSTHLRRPASFTRPLETTGCRWHDNIKTYLNEIGWKDVDWIDLAQNRDKWRIFVNAVMILRVP
jgi:hypothetical protein